MDRRSHFLSGKRPLECTFAGDHTGLNDKCSGKESPRDTRAGVSVQFLNLKLFQGGESLTSFWTSVGEIKCSLSTSSHKLGIHESMLSISNTFIQSEYIGSLLPIAQKPTPVRAGLLSSFS